MDKDDTKANAVYIENFNDIIIHGKEGWWNHILVLAEMEALNIMVISSLFRGMMRISYHDIWPF